MESKIWKLTHKKNTTVNKIFVSPDIRGYIYICIYLNKPSVPPQINSWQITRKIFPHTQHTLPEHGFTQFLAITCMNILLLLLLDNRWVRYHTANIPVISKKPTKAGLLQPWCLLPPSSLQHTQTHHCIAQNIRASSPVPHSEGAAVTPAAWGRPVRKSEHHQRQ